MSVEVADHRDAIGEVLGSAFGDVIQRLPGLHGPAGAYGLVGMGAFFAGAARAPLTAVITWHR
jgi:CIC family chloride channel protein